MAAKGVDVTQASERDLAISKAAAKAGATEQAQTAARQEKLSATERGIGVLGAVQQSQAGLLTQERGLTQAGANLLPQVGGVQEKLGVGAAGELTGELTRSMSEKMLGQDSEVKQGEFTQPGVVTPRFFDKETGKMVDAGGNEIVIPKVEAPTRNFKPANKGVGLRDASWGGANSGGGFGGGGTGVGGGTGAPGGHGDAPGPSGNF
jgi:hypothetical protein